MWSLNIAFLLPRLLWWPNSSYYYYYFWFIFIFYFFYTRKLHYYRSRGPPAAAIITRLLQRAAGGAPSSLWQDRFPAAKCAGAQIRRGSITVARNKKRLVITGRYFILVRSKTTQLMRETVVSLISLVTSTSCSNKNLPWCKSDVPDEKQKTPKTHKKNTVVFLKASQPVYISDVTVTLTFYNAAESICQV